MHRKTRWLGAAGFVAAATLTLAACSSSTEPEAADAASSTDAAATSEAEPAEVTIWHYWDGTNADTFDQMAKQYDDANDNVTIATTQVPNPDFLTKLRASSTSSTLPTIAIGDLVWVPQINQIGTLADMSGLLPADTASDINPALVSFGTIDDKQVSVPVSANNLELIYNKDLFKEAGLDPETPPATWDEVKSMGKAVLDKTGKPGYELFTQAGDNGEGLTWNFQVNLWQTGGEFLTDDNSAAAFNNDAGKEALNYWVDLITSGVSNYAAWGELGKGAAGMATDGSWMVGIWAPDPPFDFGTGRAPQPSDGVAATNLGGEQAMIFDNDPNATKAAADFLAWFLQPEQVTSWSETTGMIPVTDSVATSADYLGWVDESQPRLRPFVEAMADAHARPNTPLYPQISLAFAQQIEKALAGEATVDEALAAAEEAVNEVIAQG